MNATGATTRNIRKSNRKKIFHLIYEKNAISKQDIAAQLKISLPTVTQNIAELEKMDLIEKNGFFKSTGGRKAKIISIRAQARIALGVEIRAEGCTIAAVDLYGTVIAQQLFELPFQYCEQYFISLCKEIECFIGALKIPHSKILGLGIIIQALISDDGQRVTYGKILDCTGLNTSFFQDYFHFPCRLFHDAEAAARNELWERPDITDAVFFNIRENLSGAVIIGGKFHKANELKSGVFEHMILVPEGKPCYCGKHGCMNAYCSAQGFLQEGETIKDFEEKRKSADLNAQNRWTIFLQRLSEAIDNLHMVIGSDVILGGYVSELISDADLEKLHDMVLSRTAFPFGRSFIHRAASINVPVARGGALFMISSFLNDLPQPEA